VHVSLYLSEITSEHVHYRNWQVLLLAELTTDFVDWVQVLLLVQVGNVTGIQHIIDVLEHLLIHDLGIDEEETCCLVFGACLHQSFLGILSPVLHSVAFDDFNLEEPVVCEEGRQPRQRLPSTATDTKQECIAERLANNSCDPRDMITCIEEHDQVHLNLDCAVVFLQELLDLADEHCQVHDLPVDPRLGVNAVHEITVDHPFGIEDAFCFKLEGRACLVTEVILKPLSVRRVDQPIAEYTHILVHPEAHDMDCFEHAPSVGEAETLRNSGDISQVEQIMRLVGCWLKWARQDRVVYSEGHCDQWLD